MAAERQIQNFGKNKVFTFGFVVVIGLFLCGGVIFATAEKSVDDTGTGPVRYMSRALKYISAEQGKKYLSEAGVGTASQLPNTNTLLITGQPRDLIKASAILRLVDSKKQFVVKMISPVSEAESIPSNREVAIEIGAILIGTFADPPLGGTEAKAIIDIHEDSVLAIASVEKIDEIIAVVERAKKAVTLPTSKMAGRLAKRTPGPGIKEPSVPQIARTVKPPDEPELGEVVQSRLQKADIPDEPAGLADEQEPESDEFFDKLISSLAEAEAKMAQLEQTRVKPDETEVALKPGGKIETQPGITVTLQKQTEQRKPFVEPEQPVTEPKAVLQETKQPTEAELSAIIEKLVAEEVAKRLAAEVPQEALVEPAEPVEEATGRPYQPEVTIDGNDMLDLDLPEKLEIIDLLGLVGEHFHVDYMYDPAKVKGAVSLRLRGPIKVKDLYPLLESVLKFQGFVMTRKEDLVTIVPAEEVLNIDPVIVDTEKGDIEVGDVIVSRVFRLKHIDAASAQNLLDGMKLGANINTSASGVGALIVTGYAYRMQRIEELLNMVDLPGEPREFRFRSLKYTMAADLAPKVKILAEQLGTVSISIGATATAPPASLKQKRGESAAAFRRRQQAAAKRRAPTQKPAVAAAAGPAVYLDADERTNRILMIGLREQMDVVDELVDALDVEQADVRTLRLYDIQNVGAEEVQEKLNELGITSSVSGTSRRGSSRLRSGRTPPAATKKPPASSRRTGGTAQETLTEEPQVVVIESTNSLLVNATDEQHTRIAMIIGYVDNETLEQAIRYKIYPLENQSPVDIADVLQKLIQETITDKAGKIEQVIQKQDEEIVIVPDENTFSLIVYASKKNQEWIGNLIKTLDKRRPMVLIDTTLVEISKADAFTYDLKLVSKFPHIEPGGTLAGISEEMLTSFLGNTAAEATSILGDAGAARGFYADRHIQALLDLMQKKGYGRVLAKPKILVNDNEAGNINTKNTIYIARTAQTGRVSGSTVGDDFFSKSVTFEEYSSGIDLTITPHISEGDLLRLEIVMSRSSQPAPEGGIGENEPPPDKSENNIDTVVTVPDNSTIILGGILTLEQSKDNWKVPLLGDIPLIGGLFRKINNSSTDKKLYIFVKANILRPSETEFGLPDLERISERNRIAFERAEGAFQKHQDWPGLKPEPMDPLKVLEAE
ncbi:MAG: secretin N-terminal domain-containing protein [Planctomycetota bacterium]|jgi:type II secretory pathway component GspD/PulD (secretin)